MNSHSKDIDSCSERELISAASKGDPLSFEELEKRNKDKIFKWILGVTKNEHDAEDIYQQTIFKCWRNLAKFKGKSRFSTWACRIGYNVFADLYKKKARKKADSLDKILEENPYFESTLPQTQPEGFRNLEIEDLRENLNGVLGKLSKPHREVLELVSYRDMNYQEIAKETNCSIGTVMSRIFYARQNARRILKGQVSREGAKYSND